MSINNFDTSSTGTNLELSWHHDSFMSQMNFTDEIRRLETATNFLIHFPHCRESLWELINDGGQKDPVELESYDSNTGDVIDMLESLWGKEDSQEEAFTSFGGIYLNFEEKLPLRAMDTCDLKCLLEELMERDYGPGDFPDKYREYFCSKYYVMGIRGYSQGDYAEVVISHEYFVENSEWLNEAYLENLFYGSVITASLIVDEDVGHEVQLNGYDVEALRVSFLKDVEEMHAEHPALVYIVKWTKEQIEKEPKHD